jgi:uncharacterized protein YdiU (UPF0061 family)
LLRAGAVVPETYTRWFEEVCTSTALLAAHWMRVGFVHGVLNTDNMSVLGLTIDYGPYGWIDDYDPDWTPNTTDASGRRYRFGYQPKIVGWNLARFAEALLPLCNDQAGLQVALDGFGERFEQVNRELQRAKLGFPPDSMPSNDAPSADTPESVHEALLELLTRGETDMTLFYRRLALVQVEAKSTDEALLEPLLDAYYAEPTAALKTALVAWLRRYENCLVSYDAIAGRRERMDAVNPKYVLRNYLAQLAIDDAERGDSALVGQLLDLLRRPYDEQPEHERFAAKPPDWARSRPGCSMLSCSS